MVSQAQHDKTVGVYGGKFYPFHRGHLSFILKAATMVDILYVVVQHDEKYERSLLTEGSEFQWITPETREDWIRETLESHSNIRVLSSYEHRSEAHMDDPLIETGYIELIEAVGGRIDVIFSNTHDYDDYFAKYLPESKHVVFYEARDIIDISATQIRNEGVVKNWEFLPPAVQKYYGQHLR